MTPSQRTQAHADMATRTFGVEIETYGLGIERAARVVAEVLGGTTAVVGGYYGTVAAVAPDGRRWLAMSDGSILGSGGAEVVTPILRGAEDLETLQRVVRALRAAGARSDAEHQCGIHVHVYMGDADPAAVGRLARTVAKLDGFIRRAAGVTPSRGAAWACPLDVPTRQSGHVADLPALARARTWDALGLAWYGSRGALSAAIAGNHYDGSRYHGLNLHSLWYRSRRTVEFRYFDGSMHAGRIKAYVQLCLAIAAKAVTTTAASAKPAKTATYLDAIHAVQSLGLVGEEYATLRHHLLAPWHAPRATPRAA